ncbi:hypothetical protein [Nocardia sp. NPDC003963]
MTSTTEQTTTTPADPDREIFGKGDPCGVCHFVTGPGEICGNVVYANKEKGRLPLYCGQEGQAGWQQQHGTPGNEDHKSELATYYRKRAGMEKEEVAELAAAESARRGIIRRHKASEPTPAPVESAPAGPVTVADLAEALPESPVEALAELARLITGRVIATRKEMDDVRAAAEERAAEIEAENVERTAELDAMRAELENDRTEARETTERAKAEIRAAEDARIHAEGKLSAAHQRIEELEAALTAADRRRVEEVERVRREEREEFRLAMREFAATVRGEEAPAKEPARTEDVPVTEDAVQTMAKRVERNEVTQRGQVWYIANSMAPRPAAAVLTRMQSNGYVRVGSQGDPERVTLTDAYQGPRR